MNTKTYSPDDCVLIINGERIEGWSGENFVGVEDNRQPDPSTIEVGYMSGGELVSKVYKVVELLEEDKDESI